MMVSANFGRDIHETVSTLNKLKVTRYVHSFVHITSQLTIVVYKFEFYPDYVRFCELMRQNLFPQKNSLVANHE